jgi:hypothetical protein
MTYPDYLRQLAADHHDSGTHATAEDYEETALRLSRAIVALRAVASIAETYGHPAHRHIGRIIDTARTTANSIETHN